MRPYRALTTGEQFRVTVARALAESAELVVIDEFTSTVDRQVAQVASHTIQKALRRSDRRLVAVTCHYDVIDWLQPDWVYQPATGSFVWRSLQRHPDVELRVHESDRSAWAMFERHHYLTNSLSTSAKVVVGYIGEAPVAFCAYAHTVHPSSCHSDRGRLRALARRAVVRPAPQARVVLVHRPRRLAQMRRSAPYGWQVDPALVIS
jgi:hypothetical protein